MKASLDDTILFATKYWNTIQADRFVRVGLRHQDDSRISTEIAGRMFELGLWRKTLCEENDRLELALSANRNKIDEIVDITKKLQNEFTIANNLDR